MDNITDNNVTGNYGSSVTPPAGANPNAGTNVQPPAREASFMPPTGQQQPQQAPATPPSAPAQPQQQAPQAPQDPWAAFPDAPQGKGGYQHDPWAAFPDAPAGQQQPQQNDQEDVSVYTNKMRDFADNLADHIPAAPDWMTPKATPENMAALKETVDHPPTVIRMFQSLVRGTADIIDMMHNPYDENGHLRAPTPDAEGILTMIGPSSVASGSGKAIAEAFHAPLEKDLSKIDPETPFARYENMQPNKETPLTPEADKANVAELQKTQAQIDQLTKLNDKTAAGKAQLDQLNAKADDLRTQLFGEQKEPPSIPTLPDDGTTEALGGKNADAKTASETLKKNASDMYSALPVEQPLSDGFAEKFFGSIAPKATTNTEKDALKNNPVKKFIDDFPNAQKGPMTLGDAQVLDEDLGTRIDKEYTNGKLSKDGQKLLKVQESLRDMVTNEPGGGALQEARDQWARAMRTRDVERLLARSEGKDNQATALKTYFNTFINNPNKIRGFSDEEVAAMRKVANGGHMIDLLRAFGNKLTVPAAALSELFTGGLSGGIIGGLTAHAVTDAAKMGAAAIQKNAAKKAIEAVSGISTKPAAKGPGILNRAKNAAKATGKAAADTTGNIKDKAIERAPLAVPELLNNDSDNEQQ